MNWNKRALLFSKSFHENSFLKRCVAWSIFIWKFTFIVSHFGGGFFYSFCIIVAHSILFHMIVWMCLIDDRIVRWVFYSYTWMHVDCRHFQVTFCLPPDEEKEKTPSKLCSLKGTFDEIYLKIGLNVCNRCRISTFVIASKIQPKKMFTIKFIFHTYRTRTVWWCCHFFSGLSRVVVLWFTITVKSRYLVAKHVWKISHFLSRFILLYYTTIYSSLKKTNATCSMHVVDIIRCVVLNHFTWEESEYHSATTMP